MANVLKEGVKKKMMEKNMAIQQQATERPKRPKTTMEKVETNTVRFDRELP